MTRLKIRNMTPADLPAAESLRAQRGHPESSADWQYALELSPTGCLIAESEGAPVAFAATIAYGAHVGWISSILVHADTGHRGIESVLRDHCIEILRAHGMRTIAFDAFDIRPSEMESLGYTPLYPIMRCAIEQLPSPSGTGRFRTASSADIPAMAELDAQVFGASREELFQLLLTKGARAIVSENNGRIDGFGLARPVASGWYLGPVIATDQSAGRQIADALSSSVGPVVCDLVMTTVPSDWSRAFSPRGSFVRVIVGEVPAASALPRSFATGGAFFG